MSSHPLVLVRLNSGEFKGRLKGRVAAVRLSGLRVDRSPQYEVELVNHPSLKLVHVYRGQIVRELPEEA
jgi:hypothetical protein